jgi:hypothetical protein
MGSGGTTTILTLPPEGLATIQTLAPTEAACLHMSLDFHPTLPRSCGHLVDPPALITHVPGLQNLPDRSKATARDLRRLVDEMATGGFMDGDHHERSGPREHTGERLA